MYASTAAGSGRRLSNRAGQGAANGADGLPTASDTSTGTTTSTSTSTAVNTTTATTTSTHTASSTFTTTTTFASPAVGMQPGLEVKSTAQRFQEAAQARDEKAIEELLAAGEDINDCNIHDKGLNDPDDSGSALHRLAALGDHQGIRLLYKYGARAETCDRNQCTPLMRAAQHAHPHAVAALLECGAKVDTADRMGKIAIYYAAKSNCPGSVEHLIKAGSPLDVPCGRHRLAPLHLAAKHGNLEMVRALVENGATIDFKSFPRDLTPFMMAAKAGHVEILRYLKELNCDIQAISLTPNTNAIGHAAAGGQVEAIKLLHGWGLSVNLPELGANGQPMFWATKAGHAEAMKVLEGLGATRPARNSMLETCAIRGHVKAAELLLDWGDEPDHVDKQHVRPCTALWLAVINSNVEMVRLLVARGAKLDHPAHPSPLLIQAARHGQLDTIKFLVNEQNLEINVVDRKREFTPLIGAAMHGHLDVVKFLIEHGANLGWALGDPPTTAATDAALTGQTEVLQEFMRKHNQWPQRDRLKQAMQNAIDGAQPDMMELLIECGYVPTQEDLKAALAAYRGNGFVIDLLLTELVDAPPLSAQTPESFFEALFEVDNQARKQTKQDTIQSGNKRELWLAENGVPYALWTLLEQALDQFRDVLPHLGEAPSSKQTVIWFSTLLLDLGEPDYEQAYPGKESDPRASKARAHARAWQLELMRLADATAKQCIGEMNKAHAYCIANTTVDPQEVELIADTVHQRTALMLPLANLYASCWKSAVKKAKELDFRAKPEELGKYLEAQLLPGLVQELKSLVGRSGFSSAPPAGQLPHAYYAILDRQLQLFADYRAGLEQRLALEAKKAPQAVTDYA